MRRPRRHPKARVKRSLDRVAVHDADSNVWRIDVGHLDVPHSVFGRLCTTGVADERADDETTVRVLARRRIASNVLALRVFLCGAVLWGCVAASSTLASTIVVVVGALQLYELNKCQQPLLILDDGMPSHFERAGGDE